jgi:protease-4
MRRAALFGVLAATLLLACSGRRRAGTDKAGDSHEAPRSGPSVAVLDVSGGVPEQAPAGLFGLPSNAASFDELVHEVEHLVRDRNVRAVLIRIGSARVGLARATEMGAMLEALGARLPIWCHADDLGNATLYLAERACKRVWLSPAGSVDAIGIAAQLVYFHKLLAEELGLEVDFLQVGKYKGAEEPFTRDGPSPEAKASLESTLAGMRASWLAGLKSARPAVAEGTSEDGPYSARSARERGLIDEVGYFDEARDALQKAVGAARVEVAFGAGAHAGGGDELSELLRTLAGESLGAAPVALVRANGGISMEGGSGVLADSGGIVERRFVRTIARLEKDDSVRSVVLRIDSPGGSALASDLMWHALMRLRAKKPLVVSVGGMAASGGYYLAASGSVIYADPTSILGSIGVVGGKVAADRALEKIGVHTETIPAKIGDRRSAARAGYESPVQPWDEGTRTRLLETMTSIYELFVSRVAEGRGMPVERVAGLAEGRIFAGVDAKTQGLVDELGGLSEAIARARAMAGLPEDARVAVAGDSGGLFDALAEDEPRGQARAVGAASAAGPAADLAPELWPFASSLAPLLGSERALCALPFALTVR